MATLPEQILEWSIRRPQWQRDALRRLFSTGALTNDDLGELLQICKAENGVIPKIQSGPKPIPLDRIHLPTVGSGRHPVSLVAISDVSGVNALAEAVTLPFSTPGITVIYGDNGIGKSGYARILKRICRARGGRTTILPNIFGPDSDKDQRATIEYREGADIRRFDWKSAAAAPEALSAVSVFDSQTATIYVEDPNDIAFRPYGLDVFPKLASACDQTRRYIQAEIDALGPEHIFVELQNDKTIGDAISALPAVPALTVLRGLAKMNDTEVARLVELNGVVREFDANSGVKRAGELRLRISRYAGVAERYVRIRATIGDEAFTRLKAVVHNCEAAERAARLAREGLFADGGRWNVGGDSWRRLWEAARRYATDVVYPEHEHPYIEEGAQCVLCQQLLSKDAAKRFQRFEEFVKNDTAKAETAAREARDQAIRGLGLMPIAGDGDQTVLAELATDDASLATDCISYIAASTVRRDAMLAAAPKQNWTFVPPLPADIAPRLATLAQKLEAQAKDLTEAQGSEQARALRQEHGALRAREILGRSMVAIEAESGRRQRVAALRACILQTDTKPITNKNTELTKAGVSEELRLRFQSEMDRLSLDHLTVSVEPQYGAKGVTYHQVLFVNATTGEWKIRDVLSEGEYRSIALAGFLAELATQSPPSAVVFDDPVSSLDHVRREVVAQRLVAEARARQVIIFTHDLVFLVLLQEECKSQTVKFHANVLTKEKGQIGVPTEGLPWYGMALKKRIGWLRQQAVELKRLEKTTSSAAVEGQATYLWGRLRESWECGVEEVLLNGAVKRFSRKVSTEQLKRIDITQSDLDAVDAGMTLCSKWLPGHDQAAALNTPMPSLAKLDAAIESLESWRKAIEDRRAAKAAERLA